VDPLVRKKGDTQCIGFLGSFLDDRYVPGNRKILEPAAALMAEILLEPARGQGENASFLPDYVAGERVNLADRIYARVNDKQRYAMHRLISQMCAGEPYGVDANGEAEAVLASTEQSLYRRYQTVLHTMPLYLYYCGSAPVERVEAALRDALKQLPKREVPLGGDLALSPFTAPETPRYFEDCMDVTQGKLVLGFRLEGPQTEPAAAAALLLFHTLYGGGVSSKLFMQVREKLSLCYYASSMPERQTGLLFVSSGIAFENYERAKTEILAQLDALRGGEMTQEEWDSARKYLISNLQTTSDAQGRLEEYWLGQAVAGRQDTPEALVRAVENTSREQVCAVAGRLRLDSVYFLRGEGDGE
jgi:predicted Zn-dependent peptidase